MTDLVLGFLNHVYVPHVLALNLIGWGIKCVLNHKNWKRWSDIIPVLLGVAGIIMAWLSPLKTFEGPILSGLANASVAWILHQVFKAVPGLASESMKDNVTQTFRTLTGSHKAGDVMKGTGDGKEKKAPKEKRR